jgi:hypothetical protein
MARRARYAKVEFSRTYGGALFRFVREDLHRRAVRGMVSLNDTERRSYLKNGVLIQSAELVEELIQGGQALRDFRNGWDVRVLMDPWTAAHIYGYDAHRAFE